MGSSRARNDRDSNITRQTSRGGPGRAPLVAAICAALAMPLAPGMAMAQDEPPATAAEDDARATELDRVVVTGSLIPQTQIETATPVVSITAQDIQRQGFRDVYDVLRSQPLATGAVQDNQFSGGFTPSAEPISLLGLDPGFTLVLIDGRPMADYPLLYNGQSNFTDLSSIPTGMVERIDIAPGNQSSIYGSSAIAGVVNIILKKRIDGTILNYRFGTYDQGGGANSRLQLISGTTVGNVDLVYGLQYNRQDPIYGFDRDDFDSTDDNPDPELRFGSRTFLRSLGDGTYIDPGAEACGGLSRLFNGTTIYDERPGRGFYCGSRSEPGYSTILNKEESLTGYLNGSLVLNDNAELYGSLLLNRSETESNSGARFWQPSIDTSGFIINANTGQFESFQHIFAPEETGGLDTNNQRDTSDSYNFAFGLRGNFGASPWAYDTYYSRSEYTIDSRQLWPLKAPIEDFFREQFLGPQLGEYYGYPIYAPNEAAFYQPVTPEQYRSFNSEIVTESETWTHNINLQVTNTELFQLPGGPVGFAAVLQAGEQSWENPTDPRVVNDEFWGLSGTQGEGRRDNQALAVEFRVPVFSMLTANLSARYDQYENEGLNSDDDLTYKVGLEFRPIESLLIRGNYATAFKAPDMAYVFAGDSGFFTFVTDYYRCATEEPDVDIEDCSFNQSEQVFGTRSGSPDLQSITAKSFGYGIVWAPSASFSTSVDYYNIKIDDKVADLSLDTLLRNEAACRLGQLDPASPTCIDAVARIDRSSATAPVPNQLQDIRTNPINISEEEVEGITAKLDYRWETANWGRFNLSGSYNATLRHRSQQYPEDPVIDLLNEPFYSSEFRNVGSASITWETGPWVSTLYGVRYGKTPNYAAQINEAGYEAPDAGKVDAQVRFNASVAYNFSDDVTLSLAINNLTDEEPPSDPTWTDYPYYNIFNFNGYGRSFLVELNWRFGAQ